jgi:uncharacterized protein YecE (DUF72 family)
VTEKRQCREPNHHLSALRQRARQDREILMRDPPLLNLDEFQFHGLYPEVFLGTASDRYAGWLGQIYPAQRYAARTTRRTHRVGGKAFIEEVLPVESVAEYFQHFRVLELDFTFYGLLLDEHGKPGKPLQTLRKYRQNLHDGQFVVLKVPQVVFAQKILRAGTFFENEAYLHPQVFLKQFYDPAVDLMGPLLKGLVFEQEYQRKQDRPSPQQLALRLDNFFTQIPRDHRYHVELRTESLLVEPVFEVFEKFGIGQVLSHWTWLPSLQKQFALSDQRFLNSGSQSIIRLMTPRGTRYEDAYAQTHPFNRLVDGMLQPAMVEETAQLMWTAVRHGVQVNVIVNNRSGGNAPLIAQRIARRFLELQPAD